MKIRVARPEELSGSELEVWRTLQRAGDELVSPFLCPEFTLAVGRHRDDVRVAVIEDAGQLAGFLPFERHPRGVGKPVGAGLTDAQGAVLAPGFTPDPRLLLKGAGLSVWEFDHLVAGQFADAHTSRHASPIMDLRAGYEAYAAEVSRESGKTYRSTLAKQRKLGRDFGEVTHRYGITDVEQLRVLLRWKSEQYRRTGRSDRFAKPWIVALVEDLLATQTPGFAGVLDLVYVAGVPVVGHFGLRSENVLAGWFPAYDPAFSRYSPGLVHHLAMAREAAAHGIQVIDLGRGAKEYKDKLKTGELVVAEGRLARRTPAAALHWLGSAPVRTARNTVLAHSALRVPADRLLKRYGRLRGSLSRLTGDTGSTGTARTGRA
ncbi:GNAT family N-acetyltransferase [Nonomuraea sp. NPDC050310]|uniref:GNAT family N-acetyltransferase n=1 Tax=unclassified Nonomuraea TaxID=2593643 RepID=UPI0033FE05CD